MDNIGKYMDMLKTLEKQVVDDDVQVVLEQNKQTMIDIIKDLEDDLRSLFDRHAAKVTDQLGVLEHDISSIEERAPLDETALRMWASYPFIIRCVDDILQRWLSDQYAKAQLGMMSGND